VLAVAYNQGSKESDAYVKAIALSGNAAGVTKAQLAGMAEAVAKVGGTQAGAAEALAALAGSGRVAGKDFERKLNQGTFAFQAHDPKSVVYYRNVRVKKN
jgi:phage-related minor tail protein